MGAKLKTLVIKKSRWWRGMDCTKIDPKARSVSALRLPNGKMCCLGFLGRECGVPAKAMLWKAYPWDTHFVEKFPEASRALWSEIVNINDAQNISDAARIRALRPLFKQLGYKLEVTE